MNALAQWVLYLKFFPPFFGNDQYVFGKPESACEYYSRIDKEGRVCLYSDFRENGSIPRSGVRSDTRLSFLPQVLDYSRERSIHPVDFRDGVRLY